MRRIKLGFTVSELAIAIGIIGVIAALNIPMLNNYLQKKETEMNLAKAVTQIELGCQNIIQTATENSSDGTIYDSLEAITINDIIKDDSNDELITTDGILFGIGQTFFGVNYLDGDEYDKYSKEARDTGSEIHNISKEIEQNASNYPCRFEKFKTIVYYSNKETKELAEVDDPIFRKVYIDTNGMSPPNQPGVDLFLFGLTYKGKMVPAGTQKAIDSKINGLEDIDAPTALLTIPCSGYSCTAQIIKDGFRITYY